MNYSIILGLIAALLASFAGLFLKRGAVSIIFHGFFNKRLMFSLFLYGISMIVFVIALKLGRLSMIYGLAAVNYAFTSFLGMIYFKESKKMRKILGILLVIGGIVLLGV